VWVKVICSEFVKIQTNDEPFRIVVISGKPLNELATWRGLIVINTDKELNVAFQEYHEGTFAGNSSDYKN